MNSTELRIGNYVEIEGVTVVVVAIYENQENDLEVKIPQGRLSRVRSVNANPIRLTADLLKRVCGFDEQGRYIIGIDNHRYYLKIENSYILLLNNKNETIIHFWDVRYLHMLQNLFYGLKGSEIPVNYPG
jgi:hypothetical protein